MSKKILAIALFAVMVLSLVPVANAAVAPAITSVVVSALESGNAEYVDPTQGAITQVSPTSEGAAWVLKETLLDGSATEKNTYAVATSYSAAKKARLGAHSYDRVPLYQAKITFPEDMTDCIVRINGNTATLYDTGKTAYVFFAPKKGGVSEQTYTIYIDNKAGATLTKTFTIRFTDTDSAGKIDDAIELTFTPNLSGADIGKFSINLINGVVFIDYDQALTDLNRMFPVKVGVKQNGANISPNQMLKVALPSDASITNNNFFPANGNFFASDKTINFSINATSGGVMASTLQLIVEGESRIYKSPSYPVVWRAMPRNTITQATFETDITLKVGEAKTLTLSDLNASTYNDGDVRFSYAQASTTVHIDGKKLTGLQTGTTSIIVEGRNLWDATGAGSWTWKTIGVINVKVVSADTVDPSSSYRVIARTLNVRSGPGTNYGIVTTVPMNTILTVDSIANGWAKLSNGTYVSAQYVVAVNVAGAIGNYTVTASTLNVRSGPGSNFGIVGTLAKNTPVTITAISGSWGQLTNGNWISMLYVK